MSICRPTTPCPPSLTQYLDSLPSFSFHIQTHLEFGKAFREAVESKVVQAQTAEKAKFLVEQAEQERQASVIRSEGEAEAAAVISKALEKAGDGLLTIRRIEASRDIANTLSGSRNVAWLPSGGSNIL